VRQIHAEVRMPGRGRPPDNHYRRPESRRG
jgi:hypothetical protein